MRKNRKNKKIIGLTLVLALSLSSCGKATPIVVPAEDEAVDESLLHQGVDIAEIEICDYSVEDFQSNTELLEEKLNAGDNDGAWEVFDELYNDFLGYLTSEQLGKAYYYGHAADEKAKEQYDNLTLIENDIFLCEKKAVQLMYAADIENELTTKYDEEMLVYIKNYEASEDSEKDRYVELTNRYMEINAALTYDEDGTSNNLEEYSQEIGEIYIELINIGNEGVKGSLYDNFIDYSYSNTYKRTYTTSDAARYEDGIKKYLVPIYNDLKKAETKKKYADYNAAVGELSNEELQRLVRNNADSISSECQNAFAFMQKNNLCLMYQEESMVNTSYTGWLYNQQEPYMCITRGNNGEDLNTLIHEFGHFYYNYVNGDVKTNYEILETHSQGMVALFAGISDELLGEKYGQLYRDNTYSDLLFAIISSCAIDEFERNAYSMENPTVDKLSELWNEIIAEYGMEDLYGNDFWMCVHHIFTLPAYYISYSISAFVSLELMELAMTDFTTARDTYEELINKGNRATISYLANSAGFGNPFNESSVEALAESISEKGKK